MTTNLIIALVLPIDLICIALYVRWFAKENVDDEEKSFEPERTAKWKRRLGHRPYGFYD